MSEPYPVRLEDGVFRFTTDRFVTYSARFLEMPLVADSQLAGLIFDFSFFHSAAPPGSAGPRDDRTTATLLHVVSRFFARYPENILLFTCEANDGRHHVRQRLFTNWRTQQDTGQQFCQLPIEISTADAAIVGGLLFRQDHELRDVIGEFLRDEIEIYTEAKGN